MNTVRNFLSRLPLLPQFNMNPPCEITTEFFFLCGHTVTDRRCRNGTRLWGEDSYHNPASACDETCPTRSLPTVIHISLKCTWCRLSPRAPVTNSIRSDQGVDRLDPAELHRRQDFYLSERRARLTDAARDQFFRNVGKRACWETHKRLEHEFQDNQGLDWRERTYFVGQGSDERLYAPVERSTISDDEDGQCQICKDSLKEGTAPIVLPCHATHRFHTECLDTWLPEHKTCPSCRARYTLSTFQEWEKVFENRDFVRFFFTPRLNPSPNGRGDDEVSPHTVDAWLEPAMAAAWNAFMQGQ